jgi:sugar/nucleoside kinase (ribokinase family)
MVSDGIDLVVAGNLLIDDIVFADGRTMMGEPGGATLYATLGACLWGARVAVSSVAGADYPAEALAALRARGVDLSGIRRTETSLRTWLLYERAGRQVVHQLDQPSHEQVSPAPGELSERHRHARFVHLAPMPLDIQGAWVRSLASAATCRISLDPFEPIDERNLERWRGVLRDVDILFVGEDDLRLPVDEADPAATLSRLAGGRLETIVFKRAARGGWLYDARAGAVAAWKGAGVTAVDGTGAGDAFAGGYLAALARGGTRGQALEHGAVSASFAIEAWGARGLLAADATAAERRLHERRAHTGGPK